MATSRGIPDDDGAQDRSKETPEETAARVQRESAKAQAEVRCGVGFLPRVSLLDTCTSHEIFSALRSRLGT